MALRGSRRGRIALPPPAVLAIAYACFIAAGTAGLMLPAAQAIPFTWGDALFTATSAVTVTGLIVVDPATVLTPLGQGILLVLIQLGGLGLMVFGVLVLSALGLPVGLAGRSWLREDLNQTSFSDLGQLIATIARVVIALELLGAAALAVAFVPDLGWEAGLWAAVFHSVSALNNAGLSIFSDSLAGYVDDVVVNVTVPLLFIVGGLGYSVLADLARARGWRGLTLHAKLMLSGTAVLIAVGVIGIGVLEWNNVATLGGLQNEPRVMAIWFQAVTPRTAGFNTIDIAGLDDATALLVICLMVVGGGPTSTAGGIKVTTLVVMGLATLAFFRRQSAVSAFGRSIPMAEAMKVMAIVTLSLMLIVLTTFVLALTTEAPFLDLAFEAASAFGTVGLSRGATGELDDVGRGMIIATMFVGRLGPLALGFFLATRTAPLVRYPASRVQFG